MRPPPWVRWVRWGRHSKHGRHRTDLQHLIFRWVVLTVAFTAVIAGHVGWLSRTAAGTRPAGFWGGLLAAALLFWFASGRVARRLARPMNELADAAREIGAGDYGGRQQLAQHPVREVRTLAVTLNDMATRIERQLQDQRELLAAVSHELRSPLARMRVLLELARESDCDEATLQELEQEVLTCDRMVGEMLASSRLEFNAMQPRSLDAAELGRRALQRAGLPPELLRVAELDTSLMADPTLIAQALSNLLQNARRHGAGATGLCLESRPGGIAFVVEDAGPGFDADTLPRAFESFHRSSGGHAQGLGLGLALVKRIAEAHGGSAWAQNRQGGGARVGFSVAPPG